MKKYVCLCIVFLWGSACMKGQEVVDTMYLFCQYKAQSIKLTAQKKVTDLKTVYTKEDFAGEGKVVKRGKKSFKRVVAK